MLFVGHKSVCPAYGEYINNGKDLRIESPTADIRWYHLFLPFLPKNRSEKVVKNINEISSIKVSLLRLTSDIDLGEYAIEGDSVVFFYDLQEMTPFNIKDDYTDKLHVKSLYSHIQGLKTQNADLRKKLVNILGDDLFTKKIYKISEDAKDVHDAGTTQETIKLRSELKDLRK